METKPKVIFEDKGLISFEKAWQYQTQVMDEIKRVKKQNRSSDQDPILTTNRLLFCEHNPVYTLGKSGSDSHLLLSQSKLALEGFEYFKINRGGDITYHGPGQLTVYPIFDLDHFFHDVHKYVRYLEEVVILVLHHYGINGARIPEFTGVWIKDKKGQRKICAIGVHMSRWVSMHGLALNINTDLSHFDHIIPCGIEDQEKEVTSLQRELKRTIPIEEIKPLVKENFSKVFDFEYI